MTATAWLLLLVVLVLDTGSHLLLKAGSMRAKGAQGIAFVLALVVDPRLWIAVAAFVLLFLAWIAFLSEVPLSLGVMAGCITIVGVMLGDRICFGERITRHRALAIGLIAGGVFLVGWGA